MCGCYKNPYLCGLQWLKIKNGLKHVCCWILLLQLTNLSIDAGRHQNVINGQLTFQEDLSINKMESIYELISEYLFKKDVPETQNSDHHSLVKTFIIFHQVPTATTQLILVDKPVQHNHSYRYFIPELVQVLESPPPQA